MKQIEWYTLMIFVMLGLAEEAKAQHVAVSAPTHVAAGENFRVAYTVNAREVEEFRMGNVPDGLIPFCTPQSKIGKVTVKPMISLSCR